MRYNPVENIVLYDLNPAGALGSSPNIGWNGFQRT